jgi:uncharacterized membrane protein YkvA (DUF1232 family)
MPTARKKKRTTGRITPMLSKSDFTSYLDSKSREVAPRDVEVLVSQAAVARQKAAADHHPRLGGQIDLAMEILTDHDSGICPQIPYHTVSLLAEAVYYLLDPNDAIPDWIPEIGTADDALVVELAFEMGAAGVERYCAWKGIELSDYLSGDKEEPAKKKKPRSARRAKGAAPKRTRKAARKVR